MLAREYVEVKKSIIRFKYDADNMSPLAVKHKRIVEAVKYNPDTGIFTSRYKEGIYVKGYHGSDGYLEVSVNGRKYLAHRLAWFYMTGKWARNQIDHINGNTSDNRFINLREATPEQNAHNVRLRKDNTSGARGVHFSKSDQKWVAGVNRGGKYHNLGRYNDKKLAIKAVNSFLSKSDGDFFTDATTKRNLTGDSLRTISQLKRRVELGKSNKLDVYQKIFIDNMLSGWGAWAYEGVKDKSPVSPLVRLIASVEGHGSINAGGIVHIVESLYRRGYKGDDLMNRVASVIATIKHKSHEPCSDEEAAFIDRMIIKTFGRNSPIVRVAVNYYVYGHNRQSIAEYIAKITNFELTPKLCRERVEWCLGFFREKIFAAIEYETSSKDKIAS